MAGGIRMLVRSLSNDYSPQFCYYHHHVTNTDLLGRMTRIINYETKRHGVELDCKVEDFVKNLNETGDDRLHVLTYGDLAEDLLITEVDDKEQVNTRLQTDEIYEQPWERCVAVLTADFTDKELSYKEISRHFSEMSKIPSQFTRHPVFVIKTDVNESFAKDVCAAYAKDQFHDDLDKEIHVVIIKSRSKSTRVAGVPAVSVSELGEKSRSSELKITGELGGKVKVEEKKDMIRKSERLKRNLSVNQMEDDSTEQRTKSKSPPKSPPKSPARSPRKSQHSVTHDQGGSTSPPLPVKKRHIEPTQSEVAASNQPTAGVSETVKEGHFNVPLRFSQLGFDSAPNSPMSVSASGSTDISPNVGSTSETDSIASAKQSIDEEGNINVSVAISAKIKAAISNQFQNNMIDKFEKIEKYLLNVKGLLDSKPEYVKEQRRDSKPEYVKEEGRLLSLLDKLIFEIRSLLRLSTTKRGERRKQNQRPQISHDLVKQLLRMEHVVACGHIYGIFNVHVDGAVEPEVRNQTKENVKRFLQENKYDEECVISHFRSSNQLGQILISCP